MTASVALHDKAFVSVTLRSVDGRMSPTPHRGDRLSDSARITTSFGAESTAAEVIRGMDLSGRRVIVTGGASGIGVETARAFAGAGAEVTLAVRDLDAGARTVADVIETTGNEHVRVAFLDLVDHASIAVFVNAWEGPLHILVNNAAVMATPETRTPEGWELQFATNHLGHFALSIGLLEALEAAGQARVVSLSSAAHLGSPVIFEDIHFTRRQYDPQLAYRQSKTANVLFAVEATRRWGSKGVTVNAVMPGRIDTRLQRHVSAEETARLRAQSAAANRGPLLIKTPEQGAATSVLVAVSPLLEGIGGRYFEDCNEAKAAVAGTPSGVAAHALDPDAAGRLWDLSLELLAS